MRLQHCSAAFVLFIFYWKLEIFMLLPGHLIKRFNAPALKKTFEPDSRNDALRRLSQGVILETGIIVRGCGHCMAIAVPPAYDLALGAARACCIPRDFYGGHDLQVDFAEDNIQLTYNGLKAVQQLESVPDYLSVVRNSRRDAEVIRLDSGYYAPWFGNKRDSVLDPRYVLAGLAFFKQDAAVIGGSYWACPKRNTHVWETTWEAGVEPDPAQDWHLIFVVAECHVTASKPA